ncbi:hypothetical protein LINGRAHAP2_LOCUS16961 [Linum grandiflorum]
MDMVCETEGRSSKNRGNVEDDDDVFYEELARQVLILTADDDEDGDSVSSRLPAAVGTWPAVWMMNNGGSCGGTGVFIPRTGRSRRRNGNGKRGANRKQQTQKAVQN